MASSHRMLLPQTADDRHKAEQSHHATDQDSNTTSTTEGQKISAILQSNKNLLAQNIILCDSLFKTLRDYKVIPSPMINDIQNSDDREEANCMLLDYIGRLGPRAYHRFCDVLSVTGHVFLAEHLKSEAAHNETTNKSEIYEDVFKRFPSILKVLAPGEQRTLTNYIRDKVTDAILKSTWKSRTTADAKITDERNKKVTDVIIKDKIIREKDFEIATVKELLDEERMAHKTAQTEMSHLDGRVHDLQLKYNEQLQIMMRSYDASERANIETEARLAIFDRQVKGMNVKIDLHFGKEEYATQADAGNVKISRLEENVGKTLDQLVIVEQENKDLHAWYEEERRRLFEALGLDDNGQDLLTAYRNSQEKVNSEVRRLTAEVDLLSMAFDLTSIWSLFEAENDKKNPKSNDKKKAKGTENLETNVNILKTAAAKAKRDLSDFNYAHVLGRIKERLHEVHMEIEKLKRKNLSYERQVGKLEGELDLIRLKGHMDDPNSLETAPRKPDPKPKLEPPRKGIKGNNTPSPRQNAPPPPTLLSKTPTGPASNPLPPIASDLRRSEPLFTLKRNDAVMSAAPQQEEDEYDSESEYSSYTDESDEEYASPRVTINRKLPPIPEASSPVVPPAKQAARDPGKEFRLFTAKKQVTPTTDSISSLTRGEPVLGLKHAEQDLMTNPLYNRNTELTKLDFQDVLPDINTPNNRRH